MNQTSRWLWVGAVGALVGAALLYPRPDGAGQQRGGTVDGGATLDAEEAVGVVFEPLPHQPPRPADVPRVEQVRDAGDDEEALAPRDPRGEKCRVFDGEPPAQTANTVAVDVVGAPPWDGRLNVKLDPIVLGPGRKHSIGRATDVHSQRLTLLDCKDVQGTLTYATVDGRAADARLEGSSSRLQLVLLPTARVVGRVMYEGGPQEGVILRTARAIARSKQDGRFELRVPTDGGEELEVMTMVSDWSWAFVDPAPVIRVRAGELTDAGDLWVRRRTLVTPGKVGIRWESEEGAPVVAAVISDSPAEKAHLAPGDVIVEVDGAAVSSVREAMARIPGAPGTTVRLKLSRGADFLLVDLSREL